MVKPFVRSLQVLWNQTSILAVASSFEANCFLLADGSWWICGEAADNSISNVGNVFVHGCLSSSSLLALKRLSPANCGDVLSKKGIFSCRLFQTSDTFIYNVSPFLTFIQWYLLEMIHDISWYIMIYHDISWYIMIYHDIPYLLLTIKLHLDQRQALHQNGSKAPTSLRQKDHWEVRSTFPGAAGHHDLFIMFPIQMAEMRPFLVGLQKACSDTSIFEMMCLGPGTNRICGFGWILINYVNSHVAPAWRTEGKATVPSLPPSFPQWPYVFFEVRIQGISTSFKIFQPGIPIIPHPSILQLLEKKESLRAPAYSKTCQV